MSFRSEVIRIFNELIGQAKKISDLPALPTNVQNSDSFEVSRSGTSYQATGSQLPSGGGGGTVDSVQAGTGISVDSTDPANPIVSATGGSAVWGGITGTLSSQTDLQTALNAKFTTASSSETVQGIIEIATQAEVTTGTDDVRAVTPLKLAQATRGVQDVPIMAAAMWPTEANGCTPLTRVAMATSLLNLQVLEFPVSSQTFAQVLFVLPRKYNNSTITAVVHWKPAATGSGDVRWGIQLASYRNDDPLTGVFGTEVAVSDTYIALHDEHITSATAAITPSGTIADGNLMALQINRDPGAGADTLDVNAQLIGIVLRVTTDASIDA